MVQLRWAVLLAVPVVLSCLVVPSSGEEDRVVATVNGQPITESQLRNELLLRWGDRTIVAMMQELAIEQAAAEAGVSVSDDEVERRIHDLQVSIDMQAPYTGRGFSQWLAERNFTPHGLKIFIRSELLMEKMVQGQVVVTDAQVAEAWERGKDSWRRPERMHVLHICVTTQEQAEQIRAQLLAGADFGQLAAQYSIDPYTKDRGGDLGWIVKGDKPFQQAAFALSADGDISPPVQSDKGWHIIKRVEYQPAYTPNFEDVQDDIREGLRKQRLLQLMAAKRAEIIAKARIKQELQPADLVSTAGR